MKNTEFKKYVLSKFVDFSNRKQLEIKINNGMSDLKPFEENDNYAEETLFWLFSNKSTFAYIRFSEIDESNCYVFIDNKSISLMIDNKMQRLTSYPSERFNKTIDNLLSKSDNFEEIFEFMIWPNYMISEFIKE